MKKALLPLFLGLSSFTFANESILDATSNVSITKLADMNFFSQENKKKIVQALEQKYGEIPYLLKDSLMNKKLVLNICSQQYRKLYPQELGAYELTEGICLSSLADYLSQLGQLIEEQKRSFKSMSLEQYKSMSLGEFIRVSDYNYDEFIRYIKDDYGREVVGQFYNFRFTGQVELICHDKEFIQQANPKQRRGFKVLCDKKIKDILKEYE